uniref:CENP-V/GFA domain-containing protein n=1 Tax=Ascaris lumbricoides TaxID=6252 RepID=A0A0M3HM50_ASCLU
MFLLKAGFLVCRLAHCGVQEREFETVAAWKKHVALARSHLKDAFCGTCGHHLIVPPGAAADTIKVSCDSYLSFIATFSAHKYSPALGRTGEEIRFHSFTSNSWFIEKDSD